MKKLVYLVFIGIISPFWLFGQNLVPNPSFEQIKDCDLYFDQIEKATSWKSYNFTADLFNTCSESPFMRTPSNTFDVQSPATGKGYAGILTYHWEYEHELIGAKLLQPVQAGKKYEVKFKISRAAAYSKYATNNMGAVFTNQPEKTYNTGKYHVLETKVIEESDIWYEIKAVVSPEQDFNYIVIGNFFPDKETSIQKLSAGNFEAAYYFIDDVSVVLVSDETPTSKVPEPVRPESQPYKAQDNIRVQNNPKIEAPKIEEPKPSKPTLALSGTIYDASTKKPLAAEILFYIPNTKIKDLQEVDYRTGQFAFTGIEQKEFMLEISARNYYTITQNMILNDFSRIRKDFYLQPLSAGESIALQEVTFDKGTKEFDPISFQELNRLVQILKDNPKMKIELGGYTDNPAQQDLARARAEEIKKYLVEIGGIDPSRIKTQSYYETKPHKSLGSAAETNLPMERVEFRILN